MTAAGKLLFSIVLIVCVAISYNCQAQTMHLILACDTTADGIGDGVQADLNNMKYVFEKIIKKSQLNLIVLNLEKIELDEIMDKINNLAVEENATLMFYYSGHGAYDFKKGMQFLTLTNGVNIPRTKIAEALVKKKARLTIFLTDCCSIVQSVEEVKKPPLIKGSLIGIEKLFFESQGVLDITSSRISEGSLSIPDTKYGSIFTYSFLCFVMSNAGNPQAEWKMMPEQVQPLMTAMFKNNTDGGVVDLNEFVPKDYPEWLDRIQKDQRMCIYKCPGLSAYRFGAAISIDSDNKVYISKVLKNTPAERSGLKNGDVILEINGKKIETLKMVDVLIDISPQQMSMTVESGQERRTVPVELVY